MENTAPMTTKYIYVIPADAAARLVKLQRMLYDNNLNHRDIRDIAIQIEGIIKRIYPIADITQ